MSIPKTVTNTILAAMAMPQEMWLVRVLLRNVLNRTDYAVRGKNRIGRTYKAKYSEQLRCHTIDVPLSVWGDEAPAGAYRDNNSVMHDIMGGRSKTLSPVIIQIVPFPGSEERHAALASLMGNPQADAVQEIVPPATASDESVGESAKAAGKSAAERMAAMRDRKKQLAAQEPATV